MGRSLAQRLNIDPDMFLQTDYPSQYTDINPYVFLLNAKMDEDLLETLRPFRNILYGSGDVWEHLDSKGEAHAHYLYLGKTERFDAVGLLSGEIINMDRTRRYEPGDIILGTVYADQVPMLYDNTPLIFSKRLFNYASIPSRHREL